jgi:hypothetical protein
MADIFIGFIFSSILSSAVVPSTGNFAVTSAQSSGVQIAAQSPTAVRVSVSPSHSTLTPEVLAKVLKCIDAIGAYHQIAVSFAKVLGLNSGGQPWLDRQISADGTDKLVHTFIVNRGSDPDLIMYVRDGTRVQVFRSTRDGKALAAMDYDTQTKAINVHTLDEAQKGLDLEIGFWVRSADTLPNVENSK